MAQQSIPASPSYRYIHYSALKGIDLTCDVTQTARNRASDILNIIPDVNTGNPRKRHGWRKVKAFGTGIKFLGSRHIPEWSVDIVATSDGVYVHGSSDANWDIAPQKIITSPSSVVEWNNVAFVGFDADGDYLINAYHARYRISNNNGTITATTVTDGYVPITIISRNQDGTDGYAYEPVNAFTPHRFIYFLSNSADEYDATKMYSKGEFVLHSGTMYQCNADITTPEAWNASHWTAVAQEYYFYPTADRANHPVVQVVSVEARDATGEWQTLTANTDYTLISGGTSTQFTAYNSLFSTAITTYTPIYGFTLASIKMPVVAGQDNVRVEIVEFSPDDYPNTTINIGYRNPTVETILNKNIAARYGMTSMDREFYVADNGKIYYTDPDNYDYLPDNNFIQVKVDAPIVGFHRKNTFLVAITNSSSEFTVFMINGATSTITHQVYTETGTTRSETENFTYFVARTAIAGTGAISHKSFATLVDDALFLSHRGVYGVTSNTVTSETVLANRSEYINPRIVDESDMDTATATVWQGMYVLAFPTSGHVYVLDSRFTHNNKGVSYGYECYYLDNIFATDFLSYDGNLFFGDTSGNWCRFNTDINNHTAYEDNGELDEHGNVTNGRAIHSLYATRLDSDDLPQYLKTLNKRGTAIELEQLSHSGVKLSYSKDGMSPTLIGEMELSDKFVWTLVDFEDFCFNSSSGVRTFYPKKKIKKYKYLQFILESDKIDQDFGLCAVTKTYSVGNFAKR